jgi:uncharacterized protein (TIGR02569 family)
LQHQAFFSQKPGHGEHSAVAIMTSPSTEVLSAFGILEAPSLVAGGRGLCYKASNIILKPSDDDVETQWISELISKLLLRVSPLYRLPQPRPSITTPGEFVYDGWTATSFVAGEPGPKGHFADIIRASRAFHADVAQLVSNKPLFLGKRSNRWREADLVTWDEKVLEEVKNLNDELLMYFRPVLDTLWSLKRPIASNSSLQLIHGDVTGNVLFDNESDDPPAIIDFTPYWRPAEYAEAIVAADGLAWFGEGHELIELYGTGEFRMQMLVRALYWRCLTFAIDTDMQWVHDHLSKSDYQGAVQTLCDFMETKSQGSLALKTGTNS